MQENSSCSATHWRKQNVRCSDFRVSFKELFGERAAACLSGILTKGDEWKDNITDYTTFMQ